VISYLSSLIQKYYSLDELLANKPATENELSFNQFKVSNRKKIYLIFLQALPWICAGGFILSFFPAFQSDIRIKLAFISEPLSLKGLLGILSVSGLIGYGTNYVAIQMLFKPIKKRPVWGQGLIPAQREQIIFSLANGIHTFILSPELISKRLQESGLVSRISHTLVMGTTHLLQDLTLRDTLKQAIFQNMKEYLQNESTQKHILSIIDQHVADRVGGVRKFFLQTYKTLNRSDYEDAIQQVIADIPEITLKVITELESELTGLEEQLIARREDIENYLTQTLTGILEKIDIPGLLRGQMEHFDEVKLERMIVQASNEQLMYIQYLGALLGILGGLIIWQPMAMTLVFVISFAVLHSIDILLIRFKSKTP